jgi:uncharacterized membrane protein
VGNYNDFSAGHSFLLDNGSYTTLNVPGAIDTLAFGINDSGQIVGWYIDAAGAYGFLLDQGNYTTLPFIPYGINDAGQIVGGDTLLNGGTYTKIQVPGS